MHAENFKSNFAWQAGLLDNVRAILKQNAMHFVSFEIASDEQDMKQATDMVLRTTSRATISVRCRRSQYEYRDLTIRTKSRWGYKTEIDKLREGWGDWYLYAWDTGAGLTDWMLIDLHALRASALLLPGKYQVRPNNDGTAFIAIPLLDLVRAGAICAYSDTLSALISAAKRRLL